MKKRIPVLIACVIALVAILAACNRQVVDFTFKYDRAVIQLPDGSTVAGSVDSWLDYENSDQLQVVIDGVTYLTHVSRVVLIAEP